MTPHPRSEATSSGERRRDGRHLGVVHDHLLREGTGVHRLDDGLAGLGVQPGLPVAEELPGTEVTVAALAEVAAAAGAHEADDDAIARTTIAHAFPDLPHHAGGLVAVDGGQIASPGALRERDVAVADRARREVHGDLVGLRSVEPQLLDSERRAELAADRGLHDTGGKRDCWSRTATSMVFRVYCFAATRDGWKSQGKGHPGLERREDREPRLLARTNVAVDGVEVPAALDLGAELAKDRLVLRALGEVHELERIVLDVEELVGIARRVDELPAPAPDHHHRGEHRLREELADDGPLGLAPALEQRHDAAPVHGSSDLVGEPRPRELEQRRADVDERDRLADAARSETPRSGHDERHVRCVLAEGHLVEEPVLAQEVAVVGRQDHDGVVGEPACTERGEDLPDALVDVREARVVPVPRRPDVVVRDRDLVHGGALPEPARVCVHLLGRQPRSCRQVDVLVAVEVPVALPGDVRIVRVAEGDAEHERRVPLVAGVVVQAPDRVERDLVVVLELVRDLRNAGFDHRAHVVVPPVDPLAPEAPVGRPTEVARDRRRS